MRLTGICPNKDRNLLSMISVPIWSTRDQEASYSTAIRGSEMQTFEKQNQDVNRKEGKRVGEGAF